MKKAPKGKEEPNSSNNNNEKSREQKSMIGSQYLLWKILLRKCQATMMLKDKL